MPDPSSRTKRITDVAHDIGPGIVSVIDTATNAVSATIPVVGNPIGVAVSPDGSRVYVTNNRSPGTVLVIDTTSNAVTATVPGGSFPFGVAVTPDGGKVYFTNEGSNTASVIDTATDAVIATIGVRSQSAWP
jgi:YVTN family beta-propeller protein